LARLDQEATCGLSEDDAVRGDPTIGTIDVPGGSPTSDRIDGIRRRDTIPTEARRPKPPSAELEARRAQATRVTPQHDSRKLE
jgi:hypothetical protein